MDNNGLKLSITDKFEIFCGSKIKIIRMILTFMIEDFFQLPLVSTTPVVPLELRISQQILTKFEMALMVYSGAWGKLIHEKTRSQKSSDTVPLRCKKTDIVPIICHLCH